MIKLCLQCKKEFKARKSNRKYCSKSCYGKTRRIKDIELICCICKESYKVPNHDKGSRKYCSRKCQHIGIRGQTGIWKGKKFSKKHIENMSRVRIGKWAGDRHYNWQGGKSFEPYPVTWTNTLKEAIRQRDNYKCQICGCPQEECTSKLPVHHIDYDKENLDPKNLITLCRSCHSKTNYNRPYWIDYFKRPTLIKEKK